MPYLTCRARETSLAGSSPAARTWECIYEREGNEGMDTFTGFT